MKDVHYEIERKFLIRMPDPAWLRREAEGTEITQTYLLAPPGVSERVRRRGRDGDFVYTHTVKQKLTDLRRIEDEEEIDAELTKFAEQSKKTLDEMKEMLTDDDKAYFAETAAMRKTVDFIKAHAE